MKSQGRKAMPCRPFTLIDGMIMVAALGLGFAGSRGRLVNFGFDPFDEINEVHELMGFALTLASAVSLILRLRRPRLPIRRIVWQPGTAACFAAVSYGLLFDLDWLLQRDGFRVQAFESFEDRIWFLFDAPASQFAYVIPILWTLTALGRRWRPEPGWIDRSGRLIGVGWIAWAIAGTLRYSQM